MQAVLTSAEVRAREADAERGGVCLELLMERAGSALADHAHQLCAPHGAVHLLCGPGNNGGDGLVAARRLRELGRRVFVELVSEGRELEGLAAKARVELLAQGLRLERLSTEPRPGDVIVDALFGVGLNRAPSGPFEEAIERLARWRAAGALLVAADIPSGVQSDSGALFTPCVTADVTVTFGSLKVGMALEPGAGRCGRVIVADLGLPPDSSARLHLLDEPAAKSWIPRREAISNKGTYGHLLVIAGSRGKSGAAAMAGMAALRAGVGLVTIATAPEVAAQVLSHAPELMALELPSQTALGLQTLEALRPLLTKVTAVVVGPGIAVGEETAAFLGGLLEASSLPCLLDADALNAISGKLETLARAEGPVVLTPHPGEMGRLAGVSTAEIQAARLDHARAFAQRHRIHLVLKGARTLVASPDGQVFINPTGNPGMATAGTGDILSGICGALLAQGLQPVKAACAAVYVHGLAGDMMAQQWGQMGLVATDLLAGLGRVWSGWGR